MALGADTVGIAPAELPIPEHGGGAAYREWLDAGMHGSMSYMERAKEAREDVLNYFPRARSVVICAFSCHDGAPSPGADPTSGRLARYAQSPDYHPELKSRMQQLLTSIEGWLPPTAGHKGSLPRRGRIFVDTSPLLERLYARYAGIGWIGKNTMNLSRQLGSFFLLTGLALDQELVYDTPVPDHCGSCTRCLDSCPTDAFPAPNVLDASRCISYFTIEQGAPIPDAFRSGHGEWVFGCDICQDVCPWNRFAVPSRVFKPTLPPRMDLEELAALSKEAFEKKFAEMPIMRTGWKSLLRNTLLAMGNSRDPRFKKTLTRFSTNEDPLLAEQAVWSLGQLLE
jgi:epoxyqueuosine reductase